MLSLLIWIKEKIMSEMKPDSVETEERLMEKEQDVPV